MFTGFEKLVTQATEQLLGGEEQEANEPQLLSVDQTPSESKPSFKWSICFKESIRGHENDLIEEVPQLDYLRQLASNDPNKLQDQTLTIYFYNNNTRLFDFFASDRCKSSFVTSGEEVAD